MKGVVKVAALGLVGSVAGLTVTELVVANGGMQDATLCQEALANEDGTRLVAELPLECEKFSVYITKITTTLSEVREEYKSKPEISEKAQAQFLLPTAQGLKDIVKNDFESDQKTSRRLRVAMPMLGGVFGLFLGGAVALTDRSRPTRR
jgi:hypothetical protein